MTINIINEYPGFDPALDGELGRTAEASQREALAAFLPQEGYEALAERVILAALDQEGCPYEAEVNLTLVDDAAIHEINERERSIDKSTDVLSFPMAVFETPGDFSGLEALEEDPEFPYLADDVFNPDTGELMLGDIVISIDHCLRQAAEYGHSVEREFAFLIAHSMLHLMGYDHMEPGEAALMEERQEAVLSALGIGRA